MNICIWSGFYVKAWVLTDFEDITAFSNLQKFASSFDQYGENIDESDNIDDNEQNDDSEKIDDVHKIDYSDPTCFSNVIAMTVARTARAPTRSVASGTWSNITTWTRWLGKVNCQAWSLVHLVKEIVTTWTA